MAADIHPDLQWFYRGTRKEVRAYLVLLLCAVLVPAAVLIAAISLKERWLLALLPFTLYLPLYLAAALRHALRILRCLHRVALVLTTQPAVGVNLTCKLGWNDRWTWIATVRHADAPAGNETTYRLLYTDRLWELEQAFSDAANIYCDTDPRGPIVMQTARGILLVDRDAPVDQHPEDIVGRMPAAPRMLPRTLRWRELLGGAGTQVGWIVLGLGLILLWRIVLSADIPSDILVRGKMIATTATITRVQYSKVRDFGFEVIRLQYEFRDARGQLRRGVAYQTVNPQTSWRWDMLQRGADLPVHYRASIPTISQAWGMRRVPYGRSNIRSVPISVWHAVIPLGLGVLLIIPGWLRGRRRLDFLRHGRPTLGKRVACQLVGAPKASGRVETPLYRMTITYRDACNVEYVWTEDVTYPASYGDSPIILYDPTDPRHVMLLPKLTARSPFFIDAQGQVRVRRALGLWELMIPAPVIAGFMLVALYLIGRPILEVLGWYPL